MSKVTFALTRNGIKEKCEWDKPSPCPRHVVHVNDGFNLVSALMTEYDEADNKTDATTLEDYDAFAKTTVVSYTVENNVNDYEVEEGITKLSGVKAVIREDYSKHNNLPFEKLYGVYGFNNDGEKIIYINGEELIAPDVAKVAADYDVKQRKVIEDMIRENKPVQAIQTPNCMHCGVSSVIIVPEEGLNAYKEGALLQNAFPQMDVDKREQFKTGIHPECWTDLFGDDEDDEEY